MVDAGAPDVASAGPLRKGHPQHQVRPAVALAHRPVPDGGCSRWILRVGPRHHGQQSARAASRIRSQRRAGRRRSSTGGSATMPKAAPIRPSAAEARERIPVPASALRKGDNELRITAVDDVADENGDSQIIGMRWRCCASGQAADPALASSRRISSSRKWSQSANWYRDGHHPGGCHSRGSHAGARRCAVSRRSRPRALRPATVRI